MPCSINIIEENDHIPKDTLADRVDMINQPEGLHKINTILFSVSFPQLRVLQELVSESDNYDFSSAEYRVVAIILDYQPKYLMKI